MASSTKAEIIRLSVDSTIEEVADVLLNDGGVIIEKMFHLDHIKDMIDTVEPYLPSNTHDVQNSTPHPFYPVETKLLWTLAARGDAVGKRVCFHPLLVGLRKELLHMTVRRPNNDGTDDMQSLVTNIPPRLSLSVCFDIRPGARAQPLHRDEDVWGTRHDRPFTKEDIRQLGVLVAGTKSVRENGATLVIPGSHKWDDERIPTDDEAIPAELEPGSALLFLSSTRHAGGANNIQDPNDPLARRLLFSYFFAKGYLRQEENLYLAIPREVVLKMDPEMQELIGYQAADFISPMKTGLEKIFARTADNF